jgi:hypothetical protein
MGEVRRDPQLPGRVGGRWREPTMRPVEVVGARLDGEPRCTEHALEGAAQPMRELIGSGRLVWVTEDQVAGDDPPRCSVCDRVLGRG